MRFASSSLLRTAVLVAALLVAATTAGGCRSMVEAIGYTVVDEELQAIVAARDDATQEYVKATLPLIDEATQEPERARLIDLGQTLARVSTKERELINR